jgi:hypothetical protein
MKALSRFVAKFTSLIVAVLSCFDRVISMGHWVCEGQPPSSFSRVARPGRRSCRRYFFYLGSRSATLVGRP